MIKNSNLKYKNNKKLITLNYKNMIKKDITLENEKDCKKYHSTIERVTLGVHWIRPSYQRIL